MQRRRSRATILLGNILPMKGVVKSEMVRGRGTGLCKIGLGAKHAYFRFRSVPRHSVAHQNHFHSFIAGGGRQHRGHQKHRLQIEHQHPPITTD